MRVLRYFLWGLVNLPLLPFYAVIAILIGGMWLCAFADPQNWAKENSV